MGILEELEKKLMTGLDETEAEAYKLLENIAKLRELVETKNFDEIEEFELEEGLKHIRLC